MTLTVEPEDGEGILLGKQVSDLQSGLTVTSSRISGTLNYVTDYTQFSGDPELQEGHYMALKFEAPEGSTTTIQMLGGDIVRPPVELDSDMNAVVRVTNPAKQTFKVVTTMNGADDIVKVYHLAGLKLLPNKDK